MPATVARPQQLGIEPEGLDLTPIISQPYTEAESQKFSVFFEQKRAENDRNPAIVALRAGLMRRKNND